MPYVKKEVTREGVSREQKQALIKRVTNMAPSAHQCMVITAIKAQVYIC
jgi:phenylpyruvate tautomerase PptA (4-oxalocrotonate tautomerase family)